MTGSLIGLLPDLSQGQVTSNITSDGSLPTPTQVNKVGNVHNIDGGTVVGNNQFQSFGNFTVGTGDIARFNGPNGIQNILSRVTGGDQSVIDGSIETTIPGANLFLLNPFGILFTENASLDIGNSVGQPGSFYASTADVVRPADGSGQFFTTLGEPDVLFMAPVAEFGFLSGNPAGINVEGSELIVSIDPDDPLGPTGNTLAFIGGDVTITGESFLAAPSGAIKIASLSTSGDVVSDASGDLQINAQNNQGTVTLEDFSVLDVSDLDFEGEGSGGTVLIVGGQFVMDSAEIFADTIGESDGAGTAVKVELSGDMTMRNESLIALLSEDVGRHGDVHISGKSIELEGNSSIEAVTLSPTNDIVEGKITIEGETVSVTGGSKILNGTEGVRDGGEITISAEEAFLISGRTPSGSRSRIETFTDDEGAGGSIHITGSSATLEDFGAISTISSAGGPGGNITFDVENINVASAGLISSEGSGTITLNATNVSISGAVNGVESSINNFGTSGEGPGDTVINAETFLLTDDSRVNSEADNLQSANIIISATESATISNESFVRMEGDGGGFINLSAPTIVMDQGILQTMAGLGGDSGSIQVKANDLSLLNGSQMDSSVPNGGIGMGGDVTIQGLASPADTVLISGQDAAGNPSGIFTATEGEGPAGNISVEANQFTLENGAQLSSASSGTVPEASAGNIVVTVDQFTVNSGASVDSSTSGPGASGNIDIDATGNVSITGSGSSLTTTASGSGAGGAIDVQSAELQLTNGAFVSASSTDQGNAGNVTISTTGNFQSSNGSVTTSATQAQGGDIAITAGQNMQLNNNTTVLAESSGAGNSGAVTLTATGGNFQSTNSTVSTSAQQAEGGNIDITAGQNVQLTNNTTISAETFGLGDAGDITVTSGNNIQMVDSLITTQAAQASGGNIKLTAPNIIQLVNSQIISSVLGGAETQGGNINLDPQFIILQNSQVLANAFLGSGGNITFTATQGIVIDPSSIVDASSTFGISGLVILNSQVVSALAETITPLPQKIVKIANLFAERCAAQKGGQFSSFTQSGPEGLPPAPGGFLPSPLTFSNPAASPSSARPLSGSAVLSSSLTELRLGLDPVISSPIGQVDSGLPSINLLPEFGCAA